MATKNKSKSKKSTTRSKRSSPSPIPTTLASEGTDYMSTLLPKKHLGKSIYKIEFELPGGNRCVNYVDTENTHVVFQNKLGEYMLFDLQNKTIPEKSKILIEKALGKKKSIVKTTDLCKGAVILKSCIIEVDLSHAQDELEKLNRILEAKCPDLMLKLNPFYEYSENIVRYSEHGHVCIGCKFYETLILGLCKKSQN